MHPHFLFNTLNSVSALIDIDPAKARTMVLQLSDFLRGSINKEDKQMVPFKDDLTHIQLYLEIEKVRFGNRLDVEFKIEENCELYDIPAFVLQPLVENAVKYGLYDTTEKVCIGIKAIVENRFMTISISNPFDSKTAGKVRGTGFGQQSVKKRLLLIYGRTDLFNAEIKDQIYTSTLRIPVKNDESNNS